ncbi:MAG: hypothetical protein H6Q52_1158 [Deltaproteobacteria bacterium]|nr:hypothetical protein [Deltaproteobacteria bacterium]
MADLIWLIPAFPAIGFLINGLLGVRFPKTLTAWVACLSVIASFAVDLSSTYIQRVICTMTRASGVISATSTCSFS